MRTPRNSKWFCSIKSTACNRHYSLPSHHWPGTSPELQLLSPLAPPPSGTPAAHSTASAVCSFSPNTPSGWLSLTSAVAAGQPPWPRCSETEKTMPLACLETGADQTWRKERKKYLKSIKVNIMRCEHREMCSLN